MKRLTCPHCFEKIEFSETELFESLEHRCSNCENLVYLNWDEWIDPEWGIISEYWLTKE